MDFATPKVYERGNQLHVSHGDDTRLFVEFYTEAVHQKAESEKVGRPLYKDVPFIKIMFPGDKNKLINRPVRFEGNGVEPSDTDRFPRQWDAYQKQQEQPILGTPITEWPQITKSQALELKGLNIHTVEMLANVSDGALQNIGMGARELRSKAQAWIAQATDHAAVSSQIAALTKENESLKTDLAMMKEQLASLSRDAEKKAKSKSGE